MYSYKVIGVFGQNFKLTMNYMSSTNGVEKCFCVKCLTEMIERPCNDQMLVFVSSYKKEKNLSLSKLERIENSMRPNKIDYPAENQEN